MERKRFRIVSLGLVVLCLSAWGETASGDSQTSSALPIREVSVFKDGHAFVVREGEVTVNASGEAVIDSLPRAILGTFWPYSADASVKLVSVTAGKRPVQEEREATGLVALMKANPGAQVIITEPDGAPYPAKIVQCLPSPAEEKGVGLVLVQTDAGTRAITPDRLRDLVFVDPPKVTLSSPEQKELLVLRVAPTGSGALPEKVRVGFACVEQGMRWLPNYRIELDGAGKAHARLQATLTNDIGNLDDAAVHLVVGVPSFAYQDFVDPMALQEAAAEVASRISRMPGADISNRLSNALSNAAMAQAHRPVDARAARVDLPGDDESRAEDLYVYDVPNVTLRKGERMVTPVSTFDLDYEDIYRLAVPIRPPAEVRNTADSSLQARVAQMLAEPKVMHVIRVTNAGRAPLTTGPTLLLSGGRVIAQSMMTYTPAGARSDLELTAAVDVQVMRDEQEKGRIPDALSWNGDRYQRINLAGTLHLSNLRTQPIALEVTRYVFGKADSVDGAGKAEQLDAFAWTSGRGGMPEWWSWYSWPSWWQNLNGIGELKWTLTLKPGETRDLNYAWHYFWR